MRTYRVVMGNGEMIAVEAETIKGEKFGRIHFFHFYVQNTIVASFNTDNIAGVLLPYPHRDNA